MLACIGMYGQAGLSSAYESIYTPECIFTKVFQVAEMIGVHCFSYMIVAHQEGCRLSLGCSGPGALKATVNDSTC